MNLKKYCEQMTDAEDRAIDIYNAWNFSGIQRSRAIRCFTQDMLSDRKARFWYELIWKSHSL